MRKILLLIIFTTNCLCLDLEFYLRIPIPPEIKVGMGAGGATLVPTPTIISRNDGALIIQDFSSPPFGIAVKPNKSYFYYYPKIESTTNQYNVISSYISGNTKTEIQEQTASGISRIVNPETILRTISNSGVIIETITNLNKTIYRHRVISQIQPPGFISGEMIYSSTINDSAMLIERLDSNGNLIQRKSFDSKIKPAFGDLSKLKNGENYLFYYELKPGFIYLYRLTGSDLFSPNRITLGSSQNGSLTATVNNPEQALLNIQSSTNLIDWNTFKTIQNEPSLELVIPANKPKEFIRAIE
jgi:hypothetical protein